MRPSYQFFIVSMAQYQESLFLGCLSLLNPQMKIAV
jgi:hypothetical protein